MGFDFYVAWRFLLAARTQTLMTLLAITIGVGVQVFLASLISGLQDNLLETTVGSAPHISISAQAIKPKSLLRSQASPGLLVADTISWIKKDEDLSNWQPLVARLQTEHDIKAVAPIVNEGAFLKAGGSNRPVVIKGFEPETANLIYKYRKKMKAGSPGINGGNEILIGQDLASDLNLKVGDNVQILSASGRQAMLIIKGIFDLGVKGLNSTWIIMDMGRAQSFLQKNGTVSKVELQINDVYTSETLATELRRKWPDLKVETWQDDNKQLLSGLKSQSSSSLVIQIFVQLAVLLGISSVLAVSVVQKSKFIGILKAMGLRRKRVGRVFLLQGGILGVMGSMLGCLIGYILIQAFVYLTSASGSAVAFTVPFIPRIFITGALVATLSSLVAAFIPARRAASFNPIEVIRNG